MQFDEKKSSILLILIIVCALGYLWYYQNKKKYHEEAVVPPIVMPTPMAEVNKPKPYEVNIAKAPAKKIDPLPVEKKEGDMSEAVEVSFSPIVFDDPICLRGRMDFLTLPSIYLKQFFKKPEGTVFIPSSYARCLEKGKSYKFLFFHYNIDYQLPWIPLVNMEATVNNITKLNNFEQAKAEALNVYGKSSVVKFNEKEGELVNFMESHFRTKLNEPFLKIDIVKNSLEEFPAYWPFAPKIHPYAKFIDNNKVLEWVKDANSNILAIDMRSNKHQDMFKLFFPSKSFPGKQVRPHNKFMSAAELNEFAKLDLKGVKKDSKLIILGQNKEDFAPYNSALFFTLRNWADINILIDGVSTLGGPDSKTFTFPGDEISPDQLKSMMKMDPSLVLVDCRDPSNGSTHLSIKNSVRIPYVNDAPEGSNVNNYNPNAEGVIASLKSKNISSVVLYGPVKLNEKILSIASQLKDKNISSKWLQFGFNNWKFHVDFKWDEPMEELIDNKQRNLSRRSAPPDRIQLAPVAGQDIKSSVKGVVAPGAAQPVLATPQSEEQIKQELMRRRQNIRKNRRRGGAQPNE